MKRFKFFDVCLSIILILSFLVYSIITMDMMVVISGYVVIGTWQVISMIIHAYNGWFNERKSKRRFYHWITAISLITFPVGSFVMMLFLAPVMAIYYTWICYDEVYVKMKRPLDLLK